jgi:hypothetical protein
MTSAAFRLNLEPAWGRISFEQSAEAGLAGWLPASDRTEATASWRKVLQDVPEALETCRPERAVTVDPPHERRQTSRLSLIQAQTPFTTLVHKARTAQRGDMLRDLRLRDAKLPGRIGNAALAA